MNIDIPFDHQMLYIIRIIRDYNCAFKNCLIDVLTKLKQMLSQVEVSGLRDLEQRMSEILKKYDE